MAKKSKQPEFVHCKVVDCKHPRTPWRVSYPVEVDGVTRRKRKMFSTEEKAKEFAAGHEKDVKDFGVRFGSITAEARRAFDFYRDARAELLQDGVEAPSFESLVADAVAVLRREHQERMADKITVAEAVQTFLDYKQSRVGTRHHDALRLQFKAFSKAFGTTSMDKFSGPEIEAWIVALPKNGPATRNKMRKTLKSLFKFGCTKGQGWCQHNPLADIEPEKVTNKKPRAYTPTEATKILQKALELKSPALPELALGFFAGLRPSEIMSLDLSVIDFKKEGFLTPSHHANEEETKTGSRIAPLTPACTAWLTAQPRRSGYAWEGDQKALSAEINRILKAAKVKSLYDGRRSSFISYRTAIIRDVGRVADECGNSPTIIKKHYREIVTDDVAEKYFAIRPEAEVNVTSITEGRKTA